MILKFGMELVQNGEDMVVFSNSSEHDSRALKLRSAIYFFFYEEDPTAIYWGSE